MACMLEQRQIQTLGQSHDDANWRLKALAKEILRRRAFYNW